MTVSADSGDDLGLSTLKLNNGAASAELVAAISAPPSFTRTIDGASTFTVTVSDYSRTLMFSPALQGRVYAQLLGFNHDMVAVSKSGDRVTLTFEDSIVAALRRVKTWAAIPAASVSRAEIVRRFCATAGVPTLIDPGVSATYNGAVDAGTGDSDAWETIRSLADDVQLRCFSDGFHLHFGSDTWLMGLTAPLSIEEFTGPVHGIDFDLDAGQPVSKASVEVDAQRWALYPGKGVTVLNMAWAGGDWLISSFTRELTTSRATLELVRQQFVLAEPPPTDTSTADEGEIGNVPTTAPSSSSSSAGKSSTGTSAGAAASNSAREKFVTVALSASKGRPYVWGAKGPNSFDCSGLVQYASKAAGKTLTAPSASQATRVQRISVAEALKTRGALLFRIGKGETNHVAISLGNGSTVEARGKAQGCGVFGGAAGRTWTQGGIWL